VGSSIRTGEAVGDAVAVRVVRLQDVDDGVWQCILTDLDQLDAGLYKHRVLVVDVGDGHAYVGRAAQCRNTTVSRCNREVVRVVRQTVVVQTPRYTNEPPTD